MNKEVVWFFEVKSNDGIGRSLVGVRIIAKVLHQTDELKGMRDYEI
jgi:hypothetical protein